MKFYLQKFCRQCIGKNRPIEEHLKLTPPKKLQNLGKKQEHVHLGLSKYLMKLPNQQKNRQLISQFESFIMTFKPRQKFPGKNHQY